jgi:cell division protein ZapA
MDSNSANRVKVNICGAVYTLRGDDSTDQLRQVADFVDMLMKEIASANPKLDIQKVAVLAALNVADQYLKLQDQYEDLADLLDERTKFSPNS